MGHRMVSCLKITAATLAAVLFIIGPVSADSRPEVLERIKPVGKVAIEGQAASVSEAPKSAPAAAPAPAKAAPAKPEPMAEKPAPVAKAEQKPVPAPAPAAGGDGAALYAAKGCAACHGPDGRKTLLPIYPKIAGLPAQYSFNQMKDIKSGARNNGLSAVMRGIVMGVDDKDLKTIADWLHTQ